MSKFTRSHFFLFASIVIGVITGFADNKIVMKIAEVFSQLFLNYLSMIAAPIVFLSILSTLINMNGLDQMKRLGKKVLTYTLLTTVLAASVALILFLALDPVSKVVSTTAAAVNIEERSYLHFFTEIVPSNLFKAFAENKVISIAFLGFLFGITTHFLKEEDRKSLQKGFSALFQLFLKLAGLIAYIMPIAVWAFVSLLIQEMRTESNEASSLWSYLTVIVLANLIQGVVVLPLLLKLKGISPWKVAKGGWEAILMAFFTKSSNATLPVSLKVAKEKLKLEPQVASFTLPLCTVINMNGCAAFILTTVLFISGINGHVFSSLELVFWLFMSVLGAVGNAGVPMGCFFLSSAFLMSMNVPLAMMGLILPFYALIDMEETALNVWSDLSVATIVDKECRTQEASALV